MPSAGQRPLTGALILMLVVSGGCRGDRRRAVSVVGSTSVQPFAEMLAEEFARVRPELHVEVQGGGSTAGLVAVRSSIADIGTCSRALTAEEAGEFAPITIARDGLAVVVHRSNPIEGLSRQQIRQMFSGQIANWKEVGGGDRPIRLITREEGSGTREAFVKLVMEERRDGRKVAVRISRRALTQESNGAVKELVRHDPSAIGYMSLGLVGQELRILKVDGAEPTEETILSGRYPLVRPFLFVVKAAPGQAAREFIDFVLSDRGQALLEKEGLVKAK